MPLEGHRRHQSPREKPFGLPVAWQLDVELFVVVEPLVEQQQELVHAAWEPVLLVVVERDEHVVDGLVEDLSCPIRLGS